MKTRIAIALRHKIMGAFALFLAAGLLFTGIIYHRHVVIQERLEFIEEADDLFNNALEVRRYEKNYFLYGGQENFDLMLQFLVRVEEQIQQTRLSDNNRSSRTYLDNIRELLVGYREAVTRYDHQQQASQGQWASVDHEALAEEIRALGREFTEDMQNLVKNERRFVNQLVTNQKNSIFYSYSLFFLMVVAVSYYLYFLVISPLSRIEKAAQEIIHGGVQQIPSFAGSTEIQSLITALNLMIKELDKKSEQLIQQEKMAALGTLTSGVAHELNNPLSNISSSTQIFMEEMAETATDFQQQLLTGIEQQVEKARDIVRSLLEFAREREFEPVPTDIRQLVKKTVTLIQGEIPPGVEIKVDIPYPLELEIDQRRISQALMNLLINGIQAMEAEGGVLAVGAYFHPRTNMVSLEVTDDGEGIAPENQAKIFDPFFSTKDVDEGTGLGLYVTYGIIQKHHGKISVTSQPGHGTKFIISLPLKQPEEQA